MISFLLQIFVLFFKKLNKNSTGGLVKKEEMDMGNWKLGLMIFGMLAALGFHIWADYLTTPIQGKGAGELSSEMADSIGSSISAIFLEAFDKPYELKEMSYDLVWNLGVPLLLLLIATAVFGYVLYHLCVSIFRDENTKLTYVWKGILSLALIYILANSAIKTFGVLVLNLAVAATVVLFFLFIGYFLNSVFNSEEREA
jgi:hypothetical protein